MQANLKKQTNQQTKRHRRGISCQTFSQNPRTPGKSHHHHHHVSQLCRLYQGERGRGGWLVSWCFEPSQPQRTISGLKTNFNLSPTYSAHKSSNDTFSKIYQIRRRSRRRGRRKRRRRKNDKATAVTTTTVS